MFFRTVHELESDNPFKWIAVAGIGGLLISAWAGWLLLGRVAIYAVSKTTDLTSTTVYSVDSTVSGRIMTMNLSVGQNVRSGDVMVELNSEGEKRELAEERAHLAALGPEVARVEDAISTERLALKSAQDAARVAIDQARVTFRGAEREWRTADEIAKRYRAGRSVVSHVDLLHAVGQAESSRAAADNRRLDIERLRQDEQTQQADREARIEQLQQEDVRLKGEEETLKASINRLAYAIEKHYVRAPASGRVAAVDTLRAGAFVREGQRLGVIITEEKIKAVANFSPAEALGRIHPGEPAWLHLSGFPWTQYGSISANVASVASDPLRGRIRVELELDPASAPLIPLQHGMPGTTEIEVERISPAELILRAAGQLVVRSPGDSERNGNS